MKIRKILAMLMLAVASTAMVVACSDDDEKNGTPGDIIAAFKGNIDVSVSGASLPTFENVGCNIEPIYGVNDTFYVEMDTIQIARGPGMEAPVVIKLKACNAQGVKGGVDFDIPAQSTPTGLMGTLSITSGTGSYRGTTVTINAVGGMAVSPAMSLPFTVKFSGAKQ